MEIGAGAGECPPAAPWGPGDRASLGLPPVGPAELPSLSHKGPIYPSVRRSVSADSSPLKPVLPSCFL